jgi:hypothetical protein
MYLKFYKVNYLLVSSVFIYFITNFNYFLFLILNLL